MIIEIEQLRRAPQLALLAAIDHSLVLVEHLLLVVHPEGIDDSLPNDEVLADIVAHQLADSIAELRRLIARYHDVVDDVIQRDITEDLPF